MKWILKLVFLVTMTIVLTASGFAGANTDTSTPAASNQAGSLPPTQGTGLLTPPIVSGLRILASSNGNAMVTYIMEVNLSAGVSMVDAGFADKGMLEGSLIIRSVDASASVEAIHITRDPVGSDLLSFQALSKEGGTAVFEVTYMTKSISWAISGYLVAGSDMKADTQLFLSVRNSSSVDYKGAELLLFGTKGRIAGSNSGSISGEQLWSNIKSAGQALDLNAVGELRMPVLDVKDLAFSTYIGSTLGAGLKGYTGRQTTKEAIKLEIYLETATNELFKELPSDSVSMAVYLEGKDEGKVPAASLPASSVHIVNSTLLLRLDLPSEVTAEIERLDSKLVGSSSYEESYRIRVKSVSKHSSEIRLIETFPGEWELISYIGGEWKKSGAYAFIKLVVPANGTVDTMYKVRYTYTK